MSAAEFLDWMEFEAAEPFGAWRDNYHTAMLCTLVANALRGKGPKISMNSFMWQDPTERRKQQDAAMIAFLDARVSNG